jgi:hypothetical protein
MIRDSRPRGYIFFVAEAESRQRRAIETVAGNLRVDSATAEVLGAFDEAGIDCIVLKGASTWRWLYEQGEEPRGYIDGDLLVHPQARERAAAVLDSLGFAPELDERRMPSWWREHAIGWGRRDGTMVDIHRSLPGIGASPERLWQRLSEDVVPLVVGGQECRALSLPARALHITLHAAQHGAGSQSPIDDLRRALERGDEATWGAAAELARTLEATAAFSAGLALLPEGRALGDRLGVQDVAVDVELRASTARPTALTVERIARAPGIRARAGIIARKLFPPATFMRKWSPLARRSGLGLALAYLWRPLWVLGQAPRALRAWSQARRVAGRGR